MRKRAKPINKQHELVARGDHGQLTTETGRQWPVRVSKRHDDDLLLVLLVEPEQFPREQLGTLTLECITKRGVARFSGHATVEGRDLVRFKVVDDPSVEQRREFVRVIAPQPVVLEVEGSAMIENALAVDLSGGGMLLNGPDTLALDDRVRFRLHLDADNPPIRGKARVVRCIDGDRRALKFVQITAHDRQRLIHFIFDRQRIARARTRGENA